jgi:integrase
MAKITKRTVDSAAPRGAEYLLWDDQLPGFGLRVYPSGRRTYILQYRNGGGQTRRLTLGTHGPLTADEARKLAKQKLAEIHQGADPSAARKRSRSAPTVEELAARYMEEHARPKKKRRSVESDERLLRLHILPAMGRLKVQDVTRADANALHHSMRESKTQANRALALLSKMLNLAEKWDLRPDGSNPCRHVERYKENPKERFLSRAEMVRLGEVLREVAEEGKEHPSAILAIRLLALTGMRKAEVLSLRWSDIDTAQSVARLRDSKTGKKAVPLPAPALELLVRARTAAEGSPFVCPGKAPDKPFNGLQRPWSRIRARAGIEDVRLHDLRHSHASRGVGLGLGLPIIGKLLGHTQAATTQRYAHVDEDPLREAAELVGRDISADLEPRPALDGPSGDVVEIDERRRALKHATV